jgi:hypothetical protein
MQLFNVQKELELGRLQSSFETLDFCLIATTVKLVYNDHYLKKQGYIEQLKSKYGPQMARLLKNV